MTEPWHTMWSEMFPDGRLIFYEGDDAEGFRQALIRDYDFDPAKDNPHWKKPDDWPDDDSWYPAFDCPAHMLDEVYRGKYGPMGS